MVILVQKWVLLSLSFELGLRGKDGNLNTEVVPLPLSLEPGLRGKDGNLSA